MFTLTVAVVKVQNNDRWEDLCDDELEDWTDNEKDDGGDTRCGSCWDPWAGMLVIRLKNKCSF